MSGRTFEARYGGRCLGCAEVIEVGDLLTWDEDERAVHVDCSRTHHALQRPAEVCPRCFIAKAANGACGCEDQP